MNIKNIYEKILHRRLDSQYPVFSSLNNAKKIGIQSLNDFNEESFNRVCKLLSYFLSSLFEFDGIKIDMIYVYDMSEDWNEYLEAGIDYGYIYIVY
ncbi:hypothetical protein CSA08_02020 [Candidatus Gracilibacteria bacterium]|nr:MAG: hypothetical protein CSA08_02020 [Candidatus Gracilibacteria bacterium]